MHSLLVDRQRASHRQGIRPSTVYSWPRRSSSTVLAQRSLHSFSIRPGTSERCTNVPRIWDRESKQATIKQASTVTNVQWIHHEGTSFENPVTTFPGLTYRLASDFRQAQKHETLGSWDCKKAATRTTRKHKLCPSKVRSGIKFQSKHREILVRLSLLRGNSCSMLESIEMLPVCAMENQFRCESHTNSKTQKSSPPLASIITAGTRLFDCVELTNLCCLPFRLLSLSTFKQSERMKNYFCIDSSLLQWFDRFIVMWPEVCGARSRAQASGIYSGIVSIRYTSITPKGEQQKTGLFVRVLADSLDKRRTMPEQCSPGCVVLCAQSTCTRLANICIGLCGC